MDTGRVDINQVLMQMRTIKSQMQQARPAETRADQQGVNQINSQLPMPGQSTRSVEQSEPPSFGEMFKSAVDTVNDNQKAASSLSQRFELGDPQVDLPEVMIALQKSSVSFQAMTQVRNKMVEAYKEIMNMAL
ncbi:flagellar hook-basal body complex protein FliE [Gynuella sunshinyii]|uniref:Flagellar hook-basal body complex protein FliE n=1 Tax=Gynuella sunshinyii YC6258 TaxID=1445510 RepID=A0A0C5VAJ2_9GAMM|nr:flagellar hook-basal body complex protein FliE [Gynuella sunshinyii]AJQ96340.1 flagellar hook-basal body protein [Gynuella sunshinyii YC6258]